MDEVGSWLTHGDIDAALMLLRRVAHQTVPGFPPPNHHQSWDDDALDELILNVVERQGGYGFVFGVLERLDTRQRVETYLLKTFRHRLIDDAKSTPVGRLRNRLHTLLSQDAKFIRIRTPEVGWSLEDYVATWWQGDPADLMEAAYGVRGVWIPLLPPAGRLHRPRPNIPSCEL